MKKQFFIFYLAVNGLYTQAQDKRDTVMLDTYTVQGIRSQDTSGNFIRPSYNVTNDELSAAPVQSINDVLNYNTGLDVRSRGAMGIQSDLSIRGGSFDQSLIMVDGVKLSDPQTGHHMMDMPISLDQVERVEQINNGGSRWFGPYAFSGAVNLITKRPEESNIRGKIAGGDYGYFNGGLSGSYVNKFSATTLSVERQESDGYMRNTDFLNDNISLNSFIDIGKTTVKVTLGQTDKRFGAQNFYTAAYPDQYEETFTQFGSIQAGIKLGRLTITPRGYIRTHYDQFQLFREGTGYYEERNGVFVMGSDTLPSWYAGPNHHRTIVAADELNFVYKWDWGQTSVGAEQRIETIQSNNLGELTNEEVEGRNGAVYTREAERTNSSIFIEQNAHFFGFSISGGFLLNNHSDFGTGIFPGIDVAYKINQNFNVFAGSNVNTRFPTYTDLYYKLGGAVGSDSLQPEVSENYQAGVRFRNGAFDVMLTGFQRFGYNLIDWIKYNDSLVTQAANLTQVNFTGLEVNAELDMTKLNPDLFFTKITFRGLFQKADESSEGFESNYVLDYLRHKVYLGIDHKVSGRLMARWSVRYQDREGGYLPAGAAEEVAYDPYMLCDFRIYQQAARLGWYVEVANVFNTQYQEIANVQQPGRWMRIGASYALAFRNKKKKFL